MMRHFAYALFMLIASIGLYMGHVRPKRMENEQKHDKIASTIHEHEACLFSKGMLPFATTLSGLAGLENAFEAALEGMVAPQTPENEHGKDLLSVFEEWGYTVNHPSFPAIEHFEEQVLELFGAGSEKRARAISGTLALKLCASGIGRLERIVLIPVHAGDTPPWDDLGTVGAEIEFKAGVVETIRFIEEWFFSSDGRVLIQPTQTTLSRIDPVLWEEDIEEYSGPMIKTVLKARIIYPIDKG